MGIRQVAACERFVGDHAVGSTTSAEVCCENMEQQRTPDKNLRNCNLGHFYLDVRMVIVASVEEVVVVVMVVVVMVVGVEVVVVMVVVVVVVVMVVVEVVVVEVWLW